MDLAAGCESGEEMMKGQEVVGCRFGRQTEQDRLQQPKNTLLWRSVIAM